MERGVVSRGIGRVRHAMHRPLARCLACAVHRAERRSECGDRCVICLDDEERAPHDKLREEVGAGVHDRHVVKEPRSTIWSASSTRPRYVACARLAEATLIPFCCDPGCGRFPPAGANVA